MTLVVSLAARFVRLIQRITQTGRSGEQPQTGWGWAGVLPARTPHIQVRSSRCASRHESGRGQSAGATEDRRFDPRSALHVVRWRVHRGSMRNPNAVSVKHDLSSLVIPRMLPSRVLSGDIMARRNSSALLIVAMTVAALLMLLGGLAAHVGRPHPGFFALDLYGFGHDDQYRRAARRTGGGRRDRALGRDARAPLRRRPPRGRGAPRAQGRRAPYTSLPVEVKVP
jgi:hypothetical protein